MTNRVKAIIHISTRRPDIISWSLFIKIQILPTIHKRNHRLDFI